MIGFSAKVFKKNREPISYFSPCYCR